MLETIVLAYVFKNETVVLAYVFKNGNLYNNSRVSKRDVKSFRV